MENKRKSNILSWLLFLPASILATIIAVKLLGYFNDFSMWRMGYSETSLFNRFYNAISNGVVNGCVFVFVGSFIVPNYKKQVAIFLALIINIVLIKELVLNYTSLDSRGAFFGVLFVVTALIASVLTMFRVINPDDEDQII